MEQLLTNKASRGISYMRFPKIALHQNCMKMNLHVLLQKYGFVGVRERNGSFGIFGIFCKWKNVTLTKAQCIQNAGEKKINKRFGLVVTEILRTWQHPCRPAVSSLCLVGPFPPSYPGPAQPLLFLSICHRFRKSR